MKYSEKVLAHFKNPCNVGYLEDYHGIGRLGDSDCGDSVVVTIYLSEDNQMVEKIRYKIKGCPAAVATSSVTAEIAEGKTVEEVMKITDGDVVSALDGLPEKKVHCSVLAVTGLHLAVQDAILKRLFIKAGIVKSNEEFEKFREEGKLNEYFASPENIKHECDGSCETSVDGSCDM